MPKETRNNNQELFFKILMQDDRNIYAYILSMVPNVSDADDIMQETAVVMWRKFDTFDPKSSSLAWGLTIAKYNVLNYYRKQKNSKLCYSSSLLESVEKAVEQAIPDMDENLEVLNGCVNKLDDDQKQLLKLRYEDKRTFKEIGDRISKSTRMTFYSLSKVHQLLLQCIKKTRLERGQ